MELDDGFGGCDALVGDYVLTGVVAFCWAVPEKGAMEQSWKLLESRGIGGRWHTDFGGMIAGAILLLTDLEISASALLDETI